MGDWEIIANKDKDSVKIDFLGGEEDCADLLRSLIAASIPITEFHCTQEDLESIFLKLGHKQTS